MSNGNSPAQERPSVGRTLQQARIAAKLTVDEVSATTRVRIPIVHAIEQDDFSRCGGDVYARGHIRTLARAVGLDPTELIDQFNEERSGAEDAVLPTGPVFEAERIRSEPRRPNWTAAMVAAIVAVIGFVTFTVASDKDGDTGPVADGAGTASPEAGVEKEPEPAAEKTSDPKQEPEPDPTESAVAAVPADKVTVKVVSSGRTWLQIKDDTGKELFQGFLEDGDSETFTSDERIDLVTGNAGVIELYVNGKHIPDVGAVGEVQRLSYTKGDPEEG